MNWSEVAALFGVSIAAVSAFWPIARERSIDARLARLAEISKTTDDSQTRVLVALATRAVARRLARQTAHGTDRVGAVGGFLTLIAGYFASVAGLMALLPQADSSPWSTLWTGLSLLLLSGVIYAVRGLREERDLRKVDEAVARELPESLNSAKSSASDS